MLDTAASGALRRALLPLAERVERAARRRRMRRRRALHRRRKQEALALFFLRWLKAPHRIGAVAPSSRFLARAMADEVEPGPDRPVVELGGGTGSITQALLDAGVSPQDLVVVERDPRLHRVLRRRFPRVTVILGDARDLGRLLAPYGIAEVSAVVSSLPLVAMPKPVRRAIVAEVRKLLGRRGAFIQFTYSPAPPLPAREHGLVGRVASRVWLNLPPAAVWRYRPAFSEAA